MFANLELFLQEKDVYRQKVEEIRSSAQSNEELEKRLAEAEEGFKSQVRKYLSSAINVINATFQCQYSIYKVGKDFDVNFQVVETNVRKTRPEVIADMEEFKNQAMNMPLTNEQITKINIAMEVLLTYSEDAAETVDENKESFLKEASVKATSIIEAPSRENNAFTPAPTQEPSFNPYANQPIEVDNGFKNPVYENKTLVDPFASIYGGKANISPNEIPEAPLDFGVPTPQPTTNTIPQNQNVDAMSIFGANVTTSSSSNNMMVENSQQPLSNSMDSYGTMVQPATAYSMNQTNSYNPQQPMNAVPTPGMGTSSSNSYSYALNSENMDTRVEVMDPQPETLNLIDGEKKQEEKAFIISKIVKGVVRLPITTLLFLGIIVLIFWGLEKANLMGEITDLLGDYMKYAEFALVLFIMIVGSSSVLDAMATKTKYINKHAMTSLVLFAGVVYGLKLLFPFVMDNFLEEHLSLEVNLQVFLYWGYYLALAFFIATFTWLFAFLRTDKKVLKKKHLNIIEMLGSLCIIYALVIPAVVIGCDWCGLTVVGEKVNLIYDYDNCNLIIVIVSFVLSLIMLLFSKLEEKKL